MPSLLIFDMEISEHANCALGSKLKVLRASVQVVLRSTVAEAVISPKLLERKQSSEVAQQAGF